jgi:glycosyltransferase involved in cell wall biosynthesis
MPAYNGAAFIERTLASLAAQTYPHLEVLISDDRSTDKTAEICQGFVDRDTRFRLLRQSVRRGWLANANLLLETARAPYAFFAFHDDPLEPTCVARLVELLERNPMATLAFADMHALGRVFSYTELDGVSSPLERARRIIRRTGPWWVPNRGLFRLDAARQIGGMRRHLAGEYQADHPWLLRLALLGEFVRVPEALIHKDYRDDSVSGRWNRNPRAWQSAAVLLSAAREVRLARPPFREELRLHKELARFAAWAIVHRRAF